MARIARRALRIKDIPLLSLGKPWSAVAEGSDPVLLRLYDPREVVLAQRVLPPVGHGQFGYSEKNVPQAGGAGVIVQIDGYRWESDDQKSVLISIRPERRFRILSVRSQEAADVNATKLVVQTSFS